VVLGKELIDKRRIGFIEGRRLDMEIKADGDK
jgi:hypothetical protein